MTAPILALALALAAPASTGLYRIELTDGTRLLARSRPEPRGPLVVIQLESGTAVSLRAERVARVTPHEPARTQSLAREPAALAPRPVVTLNNAELERFARQLPPQTMPAAAGPGSRVFQLPPAPGYELPGPEPLSEPRDRHGRDETYWQARAQQALSALRAAELAHEAALRSYRDAEREVLYGVQVDHPELALGTIHYMQSPEERGLALLRLQSLRDALNQTSAALQAAAEAWEALREEARRAGAFPGWLRV